MTSHPYLGISVVPHHTYQPKEKIFVYVLKFLFLLFLSQMKNYVSLLSCSNYLNVSILFPLYYEC